METHVFNANAAKHYRDVLSGGQIDRYIFNAQDGNGLGSFFAPILKAIVPVAKTIGRTLLSLAKPAAKAAAREGIKGMATMATNSLVDKTVESIRHSKQRKKPYTTSKGRRR